MPPAPVLIRAYKDSLVLSLVQQEGATLSVKYAVSPAIVYYTWIDVPAESIQGDTCTITGLLPSQGYIVKVKYPYFNHSMKIRNFCGVWIACPSPIVI